MGGYLDDYGASDARRERVVRRIWISFAVLAVLGLGGWLQFRNWRETRVLDSFLQQLVKKDYKAAYAMWGCTDTQPCPDYAIEKFLEDWAQADPTTLRVLRSGHTGNALRRFLLWFHPPDDCGGGIIRVIRFGNTEEVTVYVSRQDHMISYAPWPVCDPHVPAGALRGTQ